MQADAPDPAGSTEGGRPALSGFRDRPLAIATGLGVGALLAMLAALGGGFGGRVGGGDLYAGILAKWSFISESLRAGRFPLWNPYEFCGLPLHGLAHGSVLYPPITLVNLVLSPEAALQLLYWIHIVAYAAAVTAYLLRDGRSLAAAALGGACATAFSFTASFGMAADHPYIFFAMPYLVGILLALQSLGFRRAGPAVALALCCAAQWLLAYPETGLNSAVVIAVVSVLSVGSRAPSRLALVAFLVALGALLASAQLVPLAEAVGESARMDRGIDHYRGLFELRGRGATPFVSALVDAYGPAALVLAAVGIAQAGRRRLGWGVCLIWSLLPANLPFRLLYEVPPFTNVRFLFTWGLITALLLACFAAWGLDALRARRDEPDAVRPWLAPLLAAAVAAVLWLVGREFTALLAASCALALWAPLRRRGGWALVGAMALVHVVVAMVGIEARGRVEAPDPEAIRTRGAELRELRDRVGRAPRFISLADTNSGLSLREALPTPHGYAPALPPRQVHDLIIGVGVKPQLWLTEWREVMKYPGALSAMGVGLVVTSPNGAGPVIEGGFRRLGVLTGGGTVFHRRAAPRIQLLDDARVVADREASLAAVLDQEFDPAAVVVLEGAEPLRGGWRRTRGRVSVEEDLPQRLLLHTDTSHEMWLVVADTHYPGWEARIDGEPVGILRANHAFRAVRVSSGSHDVEFVYRPRSFRLGLFGSAVGLVLLAATWWWLRRRDGG